MLLILKNSLRLNLIFFKNYWYFFAAAVIVLVITAESIMSWLGMIAVEDLRHYASILLFLLSLKKVTGKYPVIRMETTSILFFRGTLLFKKLFYLKVLLSLIGSITVGIIITAVIYRTPSDKTLIFGSAIALYLFFSSLLAWLFYNSEAIKQKIWYVTVFLLVSCLFIGNTTVSLAILTPLTLSALYWTGKTKILWDKYYRDCSFITENMAAAAKKDMAKMLEILNKVNAAKRPAFPNIFVKIRPSKKTVLIIKSFLGLVRTGSQTIKFQLVVFAAAIILKNLAFIMNPLLNKFLTAVILGSFYANLAELFRRQTVSVIDKKKKGFFLPYTEKEVLLNQSVLPAIILAMSSLVLIVLTNISYSFVLLSWFLYCTFYFLTGLATVKFFDKQMLIWRVSGIIYYLIAIVCFALR